MSDPTLQARAEQLEETARILDRMRDLRGPQRHGYGCGDDGEVQTADCPICGKLTPHPLDHAGENIRAVLAALAQFEGEIRQLKLVAEKANHWHTCHDMNPPFPGPCSACEAERTEVLGFPVYPTAIHAENEIPKVVDLMEALRKALPRE